MATRAAHSVSYMDKFGRQYEFSQNQHGGVTARVHYGLNSINRVGQTNIYVQRNVVGLNQAGVATMDDLSSQEKSNVLGAFARAIEGNAVLDHHAPVEMDTQDGQPTRIRHRNTNALLTQVHSITLIIK